MLPRLYILWELYMKQHLLQRVIHMLFLWPNSGNGIPQACFQKDSCAFPRKTPHSSTELIMQCFTLCQLASLSWFPSSTSCQIISTISFTGTSSVFANYLSMMGNGPDCVIRALKRKKLTPNSLSLPKQNLNPSCSRGELGFVHRLKHPESNKPFYAVTL